MNNNAERLAEIEAREKAATDGEWYRRAANVVKDATCQKIAETFSGYNYYADSTFIANARQDIPWLCEQLRKAWEAIDLASQVIAFGPANEIARASTLHILHLAGSNPPAICPGCNRAIYGAAADRGSCLDCKPMTEDEARAALAAEGSNNAVR